MALLIVDACHVAGAALPDSAVLCATHQPGVVHELYGHKSHRHNFRHIQLSRFTLSLHALPLLVILKT
jgi:hypothetical protein